MQANHSTLKRRVAEDDRVVADGPVSLSRRMLARLLDRLPIVRRRSRASAAAWAFCHKVVTDSESLRALEWDWQALADRCRAAMPLAHGWMSAWWRCFGQGRELKIHCFYRGGRLVAVAPMQLATERYRGVPVRVHSAMANGHSPFFDVLFDPVLDAADVRSITARICAVPGADITRFIRVPLASVLVQAVAAAAQDNRQLMGVKRRFHTPLVRIESDWQTFFSGRSKKFRKNLRNKVNRFERAEGLSLGRHVLRSAADPVIAELAEVSRRSWKGAIGQDLASVPESRAFVDALVEWLGPDGGTSVWVARKDGRAIAYELHVSCGGITYPLRADFDEWFKKMSPGSVVEFHALKHLFDEGRDELYDSCAGEYWYLGNWTDEYRGQADIELFSLRARAVALYALEYGVIQLLRSARAVFRRPTPFARR